MAKATKERRFAACLRKAPRPDFDLPADDGKKVKLSKLKGRPVVVYFYPKDDTSGCTVEAKDFGCLMPDFRAAGAEVIGISPDGVESHVRFKAKHAFDVRLAADTEKTVAGAYGVWGRKVHVRTQVHGRRARRLSRRQDRQDQPPLAQG